MGFVFVTEYIIAFAADISSKQTIFPLFGASLAERNLCLV